MVWFAAKAKTSVKFSRPRYPIPCKGLLKDCAVVPVLLLPPVSLAHRGKRPRTAFSSRVATISHAYTRFRAGTTERKPALGSAWDPRGLSWRPEPGVDAANRPGTRPDTCRGTIIV